MTLTVTNAGDAPGASPVSVSDVLPAGLVALVNDAGAGAGPNAASGAYPPITFNVNVSATAAPVLTNTPKYIARTGTYATTLTFTLSTTSP